MQSTSDQAFSRVYAGTKYVVTDVIARRASGGTSVVCAGGIYDTAAKGGNALIGVAQSWVALTGALKIVRATLAALLSTDILSNTPILSLTTGSTAAATADIFIYGFDAS